MVPQALLLILGVPLLVHAASCDFIGPPAVQARLALVTVEQLKHEDEAVLLYEGDGMAVKTDVLSASSISCLVLGYV